MKTIAGLDLPTSFAEFATRDRHALLVYDMQVGICQQVECANEIAGVREILAATRQASIRTVFTRHLSLPRAMMGRTAYRTAMAWQRTDDPDAVAPWFLPDSPGFAIHPDLAPITDEAVFDKITMSAFEGTPLEITIRDCGLQAIAICGIALEIGIEPTVRHAADLGIVPIVITDACGFGNREAADRAIEQMRFVGDAILTTKAEYIAAVGGATA